MRRSRRGRIVHWGLVFLIYSAIQVYSASIKDAAETEELLKAASAEEETNTSPNPMYESPSTEKYETSSEILKELLTSTPATQHHKHSHPTYRPKRSNCTPPAIEQFPRPLMGPNIRKHGGLVIHVLVAVFTFLGLAIVCDDYFVASLDRICEGKIIQRCTAYNSLY